MLTLPKYMTPWHANTSLAANAYAPAGHELAHHQSKLPYWKYKLPGANLFSFQIPSSKNQNCVSSTF